MPVSSASVTDILIGLRVRRRRIELGISLQRMAEAVGVSYQQIQKYEKGKNRISVTRLLEFSYLLQAPVSYFVKGLEYTEEPRRC